MDDRFARVTRLAASQAGAVGLEQLDNDGVHRRLRSEWVARGLVERAGPHSYVLAGSAPSWKRELWCASLDIDGRGFIAGRAAAQLHQLDGFRHDAVELIVSRQFRNVRTPHLVRGTSFPLGRQDTVTIDGLRCLSAERLIIESPLFAFTRSEIENAIDSAIRRRVVSEQRLRSRVLQLRGRRVKGVCQLLDALVDTGGESRLERWFLALVRQGGLPRPQLQRVWRDGTRTIARVDAYFPGGLVVELAGHGTHASRQQRQHDEQRRTELTLRGVRSITFTYEDLRDRSDWVLAQLRIALLNLVDVTNCREYPDIW